MAATIKDIAKIVGVSPSTVSRAITGRATISEETRKRISDTMTMLNYHPNSSARNLANGISKTICLLIDASDESSTFSNAFFTNSVFGIEKIVQEKGYDLLTAGSYEGKLSETIDKLMLERKADGIIIPPSLAKKRILQKLISERIPFVVLGEPAILSNQCSWADINNFQGAVLATEHLKEEGYSQLAYFGGNDSDAFVQKRIAGFRLSTGSNNLVFKTGSTEEDMKQSAEIMLSDTAIDAVVCNDNFAAYAVLKVAKEKGMEVPARLGMITFDNYPIAPYMDPPLSCIDIDTLSLGSEATRILINLIEGSKQQQTLISTSLIPRISSRRANG